MLKNTFCHIPGIRTKSERKLWHDGVLTWEDYLARPGRSFPKVNTVFLRSGLVESQKRLVSRDAAYFTKALQTPEHWRVYQEFANSTAFFDIETTGRPGAEDYLTTISLFDGKEVRCYVNGRNLQDFVDDVMRYDLIVTFNGKEFDVPYVERFFGIHLPQGHIDLRFLLKSLGYTGGLKSCEKQLGINRAELDGMNGYFAVLLWQDYVNRRNEKALETLLAYNVLDAVNLHTLLIACHNLKLVQTPFLDSHTLYAPPPPANPYSPDRETVERIMSDYGL